MKNLIKIITLLLLVTFGSDYFLKFISYLGITKFNQDIVIFIFYILLFIIAYLLYKDEINSDFRRFKRNLFPNILMTIVFFIVLSLGVGIANYFGKVIADTFRVEFLNLEMVNIFKKTIDINFLIYFIKNILLIPFIMVITYILSINQDIKSKNKGMFISAFIASLSSVVLMNDSFLYIIINVIPFFTLYFILTYIYQKTIIIYGIAL